MDQLPCITYFYPKGQPRPKTGAEPLDPVIPDLTPVTDPFNKDFIWGQVRSSGALSVDTGIQSVRRVSLGTYEVRFSIKREDTNYIISRFSDDAIPLYPRRGPYSQITDMSVSSFRITWFNRSGTRIDTNFIFGIYS